MPKYTYRCEVCGDHFDKFHSITEKLTTCECGKEGSVLRIPSLPFCVSHKKQKAGQLVKEFIEDTKQDVEAQKRDMMKGMDND